MPYKNHADALANHRKYNREHSHERVAIIKQWRLDHPGKRNEQVRVHYAKHPEVYAQRGKKYNQSHPEMNRAKCKRRDARKRGASICDFTAKQWEAMKNAYGHCCVYCGRKMKRLTQDHLTPLSSGGNHTQSNIVPACQSCNSKKGKGAVLRPVQPLLL